jgi:hypothetical protein
MSSWLNAPTDASGAILKRGQVVDLVGTLSAEQTIAMRRVVNVLKDAVAEYKLTGELGLFTKYFSGQQQLVLVHYAVTRSNDENDLRMTADEYNALRNNALMVPDQIGSAVYTKYDIVNNKVGPISRYVYLSRDVNGEPILL